MRLFDRLRRRTRAPAASESRPAADPRPGAADDRAVTGAALLSAGQIISSGLSYVGTAVIARSIGPEGWGGFTLVLSLATLTSIIFDLQVGRRVLRDLLDGDRSDDGRTMGSLVVLRSLTGVAAGAVVFGFLAVGGYPNEVVHAGGVVVAILVIASAGSAVGIYFQARIELRPVAIALVISRLVFVAFVIGFIAAGVRSIALLLLCTVGMELVSLGVKAYYARRLIRFEFVIEPARWWHWGRESAMVAAGAAVGSLAYRIDAVLLSQQDTLASVGQYGVAYKFADLLEPVASAMAAPLLTLLVAAWPHRPDRFRDAFQGAFTLFAVVAAIPIGLMLIFAEPVTTMLYGQDFAESATAGKILVAAVGMSFFRRLAVSALIAVERHRVYLLASSVGLVLNVVLNLIFIPTYSYEGAASTTLATEILQLMVLYGGLRALGDATRIDWRSCRAVLVAAPAMLVSGVVLDRLLPWPVAAIGALLAYVSAIHLVGLGRPGGLRAVPGLLAASTDTDGSGDPGDLDPNGPVDVDGATGGLAPGEVADPLVTSGDPLGSGDRISRDAAERLGPSPDVTDGDEDGAVGKDLG